MCSHSVVGLLEATQIFLMVDHVREMTMKKACMANMDRLSIWSSCLSLEKTSAVTKPINKQSVFSEDLPDVLETTNISRTLALQNQSITFSVFFFLSVWV